jgi:heptosyltransferase I
LFLRFITFYDKFFRFIAMKIIIVKTSSLGDIIQTFPLLDYLREKFPEGEISWVVEGAFAELVRANPQVDHVLTIESKKWRKHPFSKESRSQWMAFRKNLRKTHYDLLFDLQGNLKSSAIVFCARAKEKIGFGWKTVQELPNIFFTSFRVNPPKGKNIREDYLAIGQRYFKDSVPYAFHPAPLKLEPLQEQKLIALFADVKDKPTLVCPSSAWPNKCLSEEMLTKILLQLDRPPYWFIWGNPREREVCLHLSSHFPNSQVLERLSLPLLQHVMAKCQLVVAMDSLPLHLCSTTQTPSLSFFGPSSAAKYAPPGSKNFAFQGKCPYGERFEKTCPKLRTCPTGLCLKVADHFEGVAQAANQQNQ